ncbi:MAG: hypothetical protein V4674_01055 [Patescibacteria group bacterium]
MTLRAAKGLYDLALCEAWLCQFGNARSAASEYEKYCVDNCVPCSVEELHMRIDVAEHELRTHLANAAKN